jgi:hypothetical protein
MMNGAVPFNTTTQGEADQAATPAMDWADLCALIRQVAHRAVAERYVMVATQCGTKTPDSPSGHRRMLP